MKKWMSSQIKIQFRKVIMIKLIPDNSIIERILQSETELFEILSYVHSFQTANHFSSEPINF